MANYEEVFKKVVAHAKEYGFIFQSSEIYDGLGAVYDYGPNGVELKNNIRNYWWKSMVNMNDNIVGLDSAIFMHPKTWKASGHTDAFNDPLIDNKDSKKRYRADILIEDYLAKIEEKIKKEIKKAARRFGDSFDRDQFLSTNPRVVGYKKKCSSIIQRFTKAMSNNDLADVKALIEELVPKFEAVLDGLIIDRYNDPNSMDTGRRLAKMYINELMSGRYNPMPNATAFPNHVDDGYKGMLVVRSEIKSLCSHHHQPVAGVAYIGIIAADTLIGLSKYTRIAQWCARRGTLQEELNNDIANKIQQATGSPNVGVYLQATHGCCENRGIGAHSSLTQTTVLRGAFNEDMGTKKEFMDNIKLQQEFAC